ncbi:MAG TPA: glycosyl transferase family 90 [Bryocella sp.]|nr:glycosyl transferase family 90 [Bryocella sp.]
MTAAMSECLSDTIRSSCLAELAFWRARRLSYADISAEHRRLNQARPWSFIFQVRDGQVSIAEKPADQPRDRESQHRARLYLKFVQNAVTYHKLDVETSFVVDVSDGGHRSEVAPIFVFQKRIGSNAVLFPDIDFLGVGNFYASSEYIDRFDYDQKSASAMFVGSTSGAINTEKVVRTLASPRLRAAEYFRNSPYVQFLLPLIVQCDSKATEDLLREMGHGNGERIQWNRQMMHKFIISMDGNGATCSRVAVALKSNSVLLKYNSPQVLYYFSHLVPWRHYIPIAADGDVDGIIQLEQDQPGLFRFIADAGRSFAERYLTREAVTAYGAELIGFYAESFRRDAAVAVPAPAPVETADDTATTPVMFDCMAHIQNRGDIWAPGGTLLGEPGSKLMIEGIVLQWTADIGDLSYQAVLPDGTLTDVAHRGEFCGTRGRNAPLAGIRIVLGSAAAERLQCECSATFVDGSSCGPVPAGQLCQSSTLAPLESLEIKLSMRAR